MKKLSQAEEKKLAICRERAFDLIKRLEDVASILKSKEWQDDYETIVLIHNKAIVVHGFLESLEKKQYIMKYG